MMIDDECRVCMPLYKMQISILLALNIGPHLKKHILQLLGIFFNTTLNNATSSLGSSYAIFT